MEQNYILANCSDTGVARDHNEDCMVTFDSPNGRVIAICDGMGGQAAGDVASRLACDIIQDILENNTFTTPTEAITRAALAANQGILHRTSTDPSLQGMGSTCVIVIIKDGLVYYGWVGDSRIYYFCNGVLRQISHDQSYVQQLVDSGQISAAEAEHHPQKNEITNALGLESMTPPELCPTPLAPEPGSIVMLCSDGLSGMVSDTKMASILSDEDSSLQQRAENLVNAANAAGGLDNITVQLVEFPGAADGNIAPARAAAQATLKKSNRMLTIVGIIVLLILAAVIIGVWLGRDDKNVDDKTSEKIEQVKKIDDSRSRTAPKTVAPQAKPAQPAGASSSSAPEKKEVKKDKSKVSTTDKKDASRILNNNNKTKTENSTTQDANQLGGNDGGNKGHSEGGSEKDWRSDKY